MKENKAFSYSYIPLLVSLFLKSNYPQQASQRDQKLPSDQNFLVLLPFLQIHPSQLSSLQIVIYWHLQLQARGQ